MSDPDLRIISLGAGNQSTAMTYMSDTGVIGRADYAIFADTQNEPGWVYENLERMKREISIPIIVATAGDLAEDYFRGEEREGENANPASIPFHLKMPNGKKGFSQRGCTSRYKVAVIQRETRKILGLSPTQRIAGKYHVERWIGMALDEAHRMNVSQNAWETFRYPLIFDRPTRKSESLKWLEDNGHPIPGRSACWMCPFRSDAQWLDLKRDPEAWGKAVQFDRRLRSESQYRNSKATQDMRGVAYLHSSLRPLDEVEFKVDTDTIDLFGNECEGMCGV